MRRTHSSALLAGLAVVLVASCGGYSAGGATAAAPARAATAAAAAPAYTPAMVATGDSLFNGGGCQRCHGQKGIGAKNGPSLIEGPWLHSDGSYAMIAATITDGVKKETFNDTARPFAMQPRGGQMALSDDQIKAVAAYVFSISRGKARAPSPR